MTVIDTINKLEKSKEYTSWKKSHKDSYLVHAFKMLDKANENIWQIGYYNPKSNLISVFVTDDKSVTKGEDSEVFKEQEKLVQPLRKEDTKINENKALEEAQNILKDNYKGNSIFKSFMILQNLEKIGQVWNITFVTNEFKTVNVKIDSKKGDCISHKMVSLIQGQ